MASEIKRERVLANFKTPRAERIRAKKRAPKERRAKRPGNSETHLAALRKCPCAATLRPSGEVHHLKCTGERGMGRRSSDKWGIPLSRGPHQEIEDAGAKNETKKLAELNVRDPLALAAALWTASPDVDRMSKIVVAHYYAGRRGAKRPSNASGIELADQINNEEGT